MATSGKADLPVTCSAESKPPKKRRQQLTLHNFFKKTTDEDGAASATSNPPLIAAETPESIGFHVYSRDEIKSFEGLQREFREFWNHKAAEICADKAACAKLRSNKQAIQGAIYSSWTLHKTDLLELRVDELQEELMQLYEDEKRDQV